MAIHNRFAKFTLDQPMAIDLPAHLETSHSLSSDLDLFVSSLYSPQSEEDIVKGATGVIANAHRLCDLTLAAIEQTGSAADDAVAAMDKLNLEASPTPKDVARDALEKERKWMEVWKVQMDKAEDARARRT